MINTCPGPMTSLCSGLELWTATLSVCSLWLRLKTSPKFMHLLRQMQDLGILLYLYLFLCFYLCFIISLLINNSHKRFNGIKKKLNAFCFAFLHPTLTLIISDKSGVAKYYNINFKKSRYYK